MRATTAPQNGVHLRHSKNRNSGKRMIDAYVREWHRIERSIERKCVKCRKCNQMQSFSEFSDRNGSRAKNFCHYAFFSGYEPEAGLNIEMEKNELMHRPFQTDG